MKLPGSDLFALKGGRQEFSYGSAFILGSDSFFDGLSYDALRLRVKPVEPLVVDLLMGAYATYPLSEGNTSIFGEQVYGQARFGLCRV